jgi:hypothetical protein
MHNGGVVDLYESLLWIRRIGVSVSDDFTDFPSLLFIHSRTPIGSKGALHLSAKRKTSSLVNSTALFLFTTFICLYLTGTSLL